MGWVGLEWDGMTGWVCVGMGGYKMVQGGYGMGWGDDIGRDGFGLERDGMG